MKLLIGEHAGFCFGVRRAVECAYKCIDEKVPCVTLGPLIHNPQEVEKLRREGVGYVDRADEVQPGQTLMIRSHGVRPEVYAEAERLQISVIDSTCPHVSAIHNLVKTYSENGYAVVIVGEADHPEVQGVAGWAKGPVYIFSDPEAVRQSQLPETALVVAQTTIRRERFDLVLEALRERIPNLVVKNTICAATSQRQQEAQELSGIADVMIVVGGRNSSNTNKLYETCLKQCRRSYLVETVQDLPLDSIGPEDCVAVTAGASTPQWLLSEIVERLGQLSETLS